ncbi:hypothetical protein [Vulcanisaeta souniana]|uniref:hypothetical protein n=1 Tax=Vulcanisaeta souniana TaxID=164452 RepID=UPI000A7C8BBB|nr:hypothetical protein [Vulcanisaeta souniana]
MSSRIIYLREEDPPVLGGDWLDGKLNAQLGIRLRGGFSLKQVLLYVTTLLTIMARREVEAGDWRFVVVDEAQYFAGVEGISPLEELFVLPVIMVFSLLPSPRMPGLSQRG